MLRETLHASGGDTALSLSLRVAKDRLGDDIAPGKYQHCRGGGASAGNPGHYPAQYLAQQICGSRRAAKGNADILRDGARITLDRAPEGEVVTLQDGERVQRWTRPGAIYTHCLDEQILRR